MNLASDVPGVAGVTDPNLVNPWGIAASPTGPFWFADNGSGVSDLLDGRGQPVPLVVSVPPAAGPGGTPTGTVFNGGAGFVIAENGVTAPSRFLFAAQDGTIAGWSALVDPTRALVVVDNASSGAVFTGLALAADPAGRSILYAADFSRGTIDVFDEDFRPVVRPGAFQDPNLPDGYAPFNVQNLGGQLFVTYARRDGDGRDDVAGAGHGFIDVYGTDGSLMRRLASQGALNSPWGLAQAPTDFGPFGGALLVGNNGDGRINAYDPATGTFLGGLADDNGNPIAIPDLWALTFGNGHAGGDGDTLFFTAGVGDEEHGLFGAVQAPGRRGADTGGAGAFDPNAPGESGDYPLPPSGGPALRAGSADPATPTADLLPLRESSLALVPTLTTMPRPRAGNEAADPPALARGGSLNGAVLAGVPTPGTTMRLPAEGDAQPARGAHTDSAGLNTFLNLKAGRTLPQKAGGQQPDSTEHVVGAGSSPTAGGDGGAEGLLAEAHAENVESRSDPAEVPETLPALGRAGAAPEGRPGSMEERPPSRDCAESQDGGGWTRLRDVLLAVSLSVLGTYWLCGGSLMPRKRRAGPWGKVRSGNAPRAVPSGAESQKSASRCEPIGGAGSL